MLAVNLSGLATTVLMDSERKARLHRILGMHLELVKVLRGFTKFQPAEAFSMCQSSALTEMATGDSDTYSGSMFQGVCVHRRPLRC